MSKHPETDFSGNRKICFRSLNHFHLCLENGSIRHGLLKYFAYAPDPISNSVFYQQRRDRNQESADCERGNGSADLQFPSTACMVQKEIGAVHAVAFERKVESGTDNGECYC